MQVHLTSLSTAAHYLETEGRRPLETYENDFQKFVRLVSRFRPVTRGTRIVELGIGTGSFLVLCAKQGIDCVGLDISPQLIASARERAERHGVSLDLRLGNVEAADLEPGAFDIVKADSVFEHVEDWQAGLRSVAAILRPRGVLILSTTNRFWPLSGEFWLPFYSWLPNRFRYWLRQVIEGPDVMRFGIDFHQFTYPMLRQGLESAGFTRVYDVADLLDPERLNHPTWWKVALLRAMRRSPIVRRVVLTFWPGSEFVAIK